MNADGLPDTLRLACPTCGCAVRPAPLMRSATTVVHRTCRCGVRWFVKASPLAVTSGRAVHSVTWTPAEARP
jgi:hypothetical protein